MTAKETYLFTTTPLCIYSDCWKGQPVFQLDLVVYIRGLICKCEKVIHSAVALKSYVHYVALKRRVVRVPTVTEPAKHSGFGSSEVRRYSVGLQTVKCKCELVKYNAIICENRSCSQELSYCEVCSAFGGFHADLQKGAPSSM